MLSKKQEVIEREAQKVLYHAIETCAQQKTKYIQSWWLNRRNCPQLDMDTPKINRRLKHLVRKGIIKIDKSGTSTSKGTRYIIFD